MQIVHSADRKCLRNGIRFERVGSPGLMNFGPLKHKNNKALLSQNKGQKV